MKLEDIKNVASIGGGVIGSSWTVLFAMKGLNVKLYDINDDCIAADKKTIEGNIDFLVERGAIADKDAVLAKIGYTTSMEEAVKDAQFVQESGPERLPIKHDYIGRFTVKLGANENVEYKFQCLLSAVEALSEGDRGTLDLSIDKRAHLTYD